MKDRLQKLSAWWDEKLRFQARMVWDIIWEARRAFTYDGCLNLSAALAFYTILSLIPFFFILVSAAAYILGSSEEAHRMAATFLDQVMPRASDVILKEVQSISQRAGLVGWLSFLAMIWTASVIFSSLEFAMGIVFRVEERRKLIKSKLLALAMIPGSMVIFILSLFVTTFSAVMEGFNLVHWGVDWAHSGVFEFFLGYLLPFSVLVAAFTAIYRVIPNTSISFRHALAGGASCAFLFEMAKHFFAWYVGRSSQYGVVYGSLEAIVIVVLWAFYSSSILLFCAEVVSAYRRRDITLLGKAFL
jgi:membrane protein